MRARLDNMAAGEKFRALCTEKMAEGMDRIVALGGGEISEREVRSYAVVITVRKKIGRKPGAAVQPDRATGTG